MSWQKEAIHARRREDRRSLLALFSGCLGFFMLVAVLAAAARAHDGDIDKKRHCSDAECPYHVPHYHRPAGHEESCRERQEYAQKELEAANKIVAKFVVRGTLENNKMEWAVRQVSAMSAISNALYQIDRMCGEAR